MKIAIQGHINRGRDIIKIFESLDGINKSFYNGRNPYAYYYMDENNFIDKEHVNDIDTQQYKFYTLEEFEKEFPFKIGDKVTVMTDIIYEVVALEYYMGRLCYKLNNEYYYSSNMLTLYKEMKEERNITLSLDKAREWYNKGGELKEIALQAFTKEELSPLPKSWDEYCITYRIPTNIFGPCAPLKYIALWKLELLRDCYRQGWKPNWTDVYTNKYGITLNSDKLSISLRGISVTFLAFQSREVAEEFLKNFKRLIEDAGDLI